MEQQPTNGSRRRVPAALSRIRETRRTLYEMWGDITSLHKPLLTTLR